MVLVNFALLLQRFYFVFDFPERLSRDYQFVGFAVFLQLHVVLFKIGVVH